MVCYAASFSGLLVGTLIFILRGDNVSSSGTSAAGTDGEGDADADADESLGDITDTFGEESEQSQIGKEGNAGSSRSKREIPLSPTAKVNVLKKKRNLSKELIFSKTIKTMNFIIFLLYPGVCARVFAALKCLTIDGTSYLVADMSVKCWEGRHLMTSYGAFAALGGYVFGIPMLSFILLSRNKAHLHDIHSPMHAAVRRRYGSLYEQFEPRWYWWESMEMIRKMLLTGAIQVIGAGSSAQIMFGIIISLLHLCSVLKAGPYAADQDDVIQFLSSMALLLTLLIAFALKTDVEQDVYQRTAMDIILMTTHWSVILVGIFCQYTYPDSMDRLSGTI
eukprot:g1911.t1